MMAFSFSLLDAPEVRQRMLPLSSEQYQQLGSMGLLGKNVELLDGVIVEKMSKSSLHSAVVQLLVRILRVGLDARWELRQEQPVTSDYSEPEPDIAVVPFRADAYVGRHPVTAELVIEVAVSSAGFDYQKRKIYAAMNVREYWIVLPEEQRVEVYTQPTGQDYAERGEFTPPQVVASEAFPVFQVDLATFFPR